MRPTAKTVLGGRRILIVEDEYFLADDLRQILSEQNVEVLGPVATMAQALAVIHDEQAIDCAVLDVNLGGKAVFPISVALLERKIPFVFATGYGDSQIPDQFSDILRFEKPFVSSALISALEAIIQAPDR